MTKDRDQARRMTDKGIHITGITTVLRPAAELYAAWRGLTELPRFIDTLERVEPVGDQTFRWTVAGPAGQYSWDAEIINDEPGRVLAWRTVGDSPVENNGSIRFEELRNNRGTIVKIQIEYIPPGGRIGDAMSKLFGKDAHTQVQQALHRFRQLMETGEIPVAQPQPAGKNSKRFDRTEDRSMPKTDRDLRDLAAKGSHA